MAVVTNTFDDGVFEEEEELEQEYSDMSSSDDEIGVDKEVRHFGFTEKELQQMKAVNVEVPNE